MNRLKELRNDKKLTQQDIADYLKVGRDTISKWEIGTNSIPEKKIVKIADYFNVSIDYLLGRDSPDTA